MIGSAPRRMVDLDKLTWNVDARTETRYLTLDDLSDQILAAVDAPASILVLIEGNRSSDLYQWGNASSSGWTHRGEAILSA